MPTEHFEVLDIVQVTDDLLGETGRNGVVVQVRSYPDGRYVYSVGSISANDDWDGLYAESQLIATGSVADIQDFRPPGDLRMRDVVTIGHDADPEFRGKRGVVDGWSSEVAPAFYHVWVEEMGEMAMIEEAHLTPTGERLDPPTAHPAESLQVSSGGERLGRDEYIVLDKLAWHL